MTFKQQEPVAFVSSVVSQGENGVRIKGHGGFPKIGTKLYTTPQTAAIAARAMRDACISILYNLDMGSTSQLSFEQRMRLREGMEALPIPEEER